MPIYKVNGDVYNIPEEKVGAFEERYPDASVSYSSDGDRYDIPVSKKAAFVNKYPKATLYSEENRNDAPIPVNVKETVVDSSRPSSPPSPAVSGNRTSPVTPPSSRFVKGKGKDTTIFGVPYNVYTHMKPETQSHYYQQALDDERRTMADSLAEQASEVEKQAGDASYKRRYELAKEMEERDKWRRENPIMALFASMAPSGAGGMSPLTSDIAMDAEARTLAAIEEHAKTTKQTIGEVIKKDNTTFITGLGRGIRDMAGRGSTWDMGGSDLDRNLAISTAANKYLKGEELDDKEKILLRGAAIEQVVNNEFSSDLGRGYKMGQTTVQSLPFMAEFLINPLSGSGKAIGKGMLKQGLKVVGKELPAGMLGKVVNGATRVLGDVTAATGMALTTGSARTAADFIDRQNGVADYEVDNDGNIQYSGQEGGVEAGEAAYKAIASQTIENFSEMAGGYFNAIGKGVGNLTRKAMEKSSLLNRMGNAISTSKVADLYRNISSSQLAKTVTDFERNTGYHGTIEEYGEEVAGTVLNAIFTGDQSFSDLGDMNQQIDTFLGVCGIGGLFSTIKAVGYRTPVHQANRELGKIGKQLSHSMGDEWNDVSQALQDASVEDRKQYLENIIERDDIPDETKQGLFQYVGTLTRRDAIKSGKVKQVSEGEEQAENVIVDDEAEENYETGYNTVNPQERNEAKLLLEQSASEVQRLFGLDKAEDVDSVVSDLGESPAKVLMSMNDKGYSQDDISVVSSFLNAKETYNGVIDNVKDGIDNEIATQIDYIDKNTHQDGSLYNATMKVDDRNVYVTGGNLVLDEESNIDHEKSDACIVVRDASTGKIDMVDARDILSVRAGVSAEQHKAEIAEQIRQDYAQRAADEINGVLSFAPGDVYDVINPATGQLSPINVIQDNGDGTVIVADASGAQSQSTRDDIQVMVEQANIAKMNERRLSQQSSKYALNNEVIIPTKEGPVRGSVTAEKDADGLIEIETEYPINGKKINVFTEEELEQLINDTPPVDNEELSVIPLGQEVQERVATVQVEPESAIASEIQPVEEESIPVDDKGNMLYHKAPVELTVTDLNDGNLTTDEVDAFVAANKEEATKQLKKTSEKPPKIGTNKAKYLEEKKKWTDAVADINSQITYWNEVEAQLQATREQPGDTTANDIKAMGEPLNGSELAAMMLGAGKLPLLYNDYKHETGFGNSDARGMFGMFSTKENGGMTVEQAGEQLMLADMEAGTNFFDQDDPNAGRNTILDVLSSARTRGDLTNYVKSNREAMAEREKQAEYEAYENWYNENFHITPQDHDVYEESTVERLSNITLSDNEYSEFISNFVDELIESENENNRGNEQTGIDGIRQESSDLLPGTQTLSPWRTENTERESIEVNGSDNNENGAILESSSSLNDLKDELNRELDISPVDARKTINSNDSKIVGGLNLDGLPNVASQVDSHGIAKGDELSYLLNFLINGIDTSRRFDTAPLAKAGKNSGAGLGTGSGTSYRDGLFIIASKVGGKLLDNGNTNIDTVLINDMSFEEDNPLGLNYARKIKDSLSNRFPNVNFILYSEAPGYYNEINTKKGIDITANESSPQTAPQLTESAFDPTSDSNNVITPVGVGAFGPIYNQFKGKVKEAISFLIGKKGGEAVAALNHPEVGDIDLVWGETGTGKSNGFGLSKLVKYHPEVLDNLQGVLDEMKVTKRTSNRINLESETHKAAVRLEWDGQRKNWLLTAFEKEAPTPLDRTTDIGENQNDLQNDTAPLQDVSSSSEYKSSELVENKQEVQEKSTFVAPERQEDESTLDYAGRVNDALLVHSELQKVNTNPTDAQKEAGNYRKGHIKIDGLNVTIENPKGSIRSGVDVNGKQWSTTMNNDYGYIRGTEGVDGDHVDVFLGDNGDGVFIVDQINEDGSFDEHKVMYGFGTAFQAKQAYLKNYSKGWKGLGKITRVPKEVFSEWLNSSHRKTKPFSDYKIAKEKGEILDDTVNVPLLEDEESTSVQSANVYGEQNKLVSSDRYEELKAKLRGKFGQMNTGFDPELFAIGAEMAAYHIEAGARKFSDFAKRMVADVGDSVRPYLKSFYEGARQFPGMEGYHKEMDAYDVVIDFDTDSFDKQVAEKSPVKKAEKNRQSHGKSLNSQKAPASMQDMFNQNINSDGRRTERNQTTDREVGEGPRKESEGAERRRTDRGGNGDNVSDTERSGGVSTLASGKRSKSNVRRNLHNFSFGENGIDVPAGEVGKLKANIEAIQTLRQIEESGEAATDEQKAILARYVGWGGLSNALDESKYALKDSYWNTDRNWNAKYLPYYEQLKKLLSPEEFRSAVQSTTTSHYTPEPIIRGLWRIADELGFKGGNVSEPAMGIGHILGLMPSSTAERSQISGFEIDSLSGRISKLLYPDTDVKVQGYETAFSPQSKDLVITNVPFGKDAPYDKGLDKTLRKKLRGAYNLHNYFIAKSLLELKDGGLGVFVTSSATMDGADSSFREFISETGIDLIGAIRLPNDAFQKNAGTSVTSDVLVFRRRRAGEASNGVNFISNTTIGEGKYVEKNEERTKPIIVNEYFAEHPDMMLGDMMTAHEAGSGGLYSGASQTLKARLGMNLSEEMNKAIERLPKDLVLNDVTTISHSKEQTDLPNGTITVKDGKVYVSMRGELEAISTKDSFVYEGKTRKTADAINDYTDLKSTLRRLISAEQSTDVDPEPIRQELNQKYDAFVSTYGTLNRNKALNEILIEDFEHNLPFSLEDVKKVPSPTGKSSIFKVSKGNGILAKRISFPMEEPKDADNLLDAVNISRSYRGRIDLPYVSQLLGKDVEEITEGMLNEGLAYRDPISAKIIDKETYLSGNVKEKLEQATIAVESNPEFQKNIVDLTAVQPEPVRFGDISYRLGTTWIPAEYIDKFAEDVLGIVDSGMNFVPTLNEWVAGKSMRAGDFAKYGLYRTDRLSTADLFVAALNQRKPKVYDEITIDHNQKTRVVNEAETQAATEKIMELSDKFIEYIDSQKAIHKDLERIYNDKYNNYRLTTYQVPAFEHYPNSNNNITLRVHQTKAVQRGLSESVLLAHQVGTGKTFTMVTLAMEMRRLNIAKKPMIVVQNATLEDFVSDFYKLYPGANLLSPGEKERSAENRKRLFNLIATGDFDAIIIPQSFLQFIPDSEERKKALIQEKIEQFEHVIETTDDANLIRRMQKEIDNMRDEFEGVEKTKKRSVKDKARTADRIKSKIERNLDRRTDDVMTFEQMGIDALFIDEAHNFKKIGFASKMSNVKGIDTSASQRANSLLLKAKWIQERNNQRNVVLATGTPITNTMAEVWTMMNFVAPDILESYHIQTFDEFATTFGTVEPSLEFTATGNFKIADRFKSYVNVPELVKAFRSHTDVVLTEDIPEFKESSSIPKLRDGMFTNVVIDKNEDLEDTMQTLINELAEFSKLSGREKKAKSALPLVVFTKAKQAAIDLRLLNPAFADNPNSKTNQVVSNVIKFYKESQEEKGTQLIFCDSYQSPGERPQMDLFGYDADVPRFNLYDDIKNKLISEGIPAKEIAIVNNYDGERRKALFEKVRNGEVRVLLGSTEKMGVGVNVQERLYALHHIDAPLRPMDFEQRNGRILRQGNNYALWNKPVNVVTYGVQGTLDATAYDRLRIKQNFINQMMKGDVTDRTMEENDDENPSGMTFNQMAATLSGDETAKLLFVAENKLKKLRNLKRSDANSKSGMADTIEFTRNWILKLEGKKSTFERAKDIVDKYFPDGVKDITVDGKVIKEKFSSALDPIIESYDEAYSVNRGIAPLKLLLNGGNAEVIIHFNEGRMVYELFTGKEHFIESRQFNGGKGLMSSIDYQLKAVEDNLSSIVGEISKFQKKIEGLTSAMSTPWGKEDELKQAEVDVEELRKKLEEKAKSNDDENKRYRMAEEPIGGYGSVSDYKAVTTKKHTQSEVGLSHPVYTSNNVASEIYGNSAKFMKFLNGYSTSGFGKGDGKINMEKATAFYHDFKVQANNYKQSLYDIRSESSLAAREIVDEIIADVDYALDYYKRLAKGEDVWLTEKDPRYKEYNPIQQLSDDIQSLVSVEDEEVIQDEAQKLADILHTPIRIVNSQELMGRNAKAKGWFDTKSGEVVIVIDNAKSVPDVRQTIFHEIVGHNGLRTVLGNKFDEFIERVFHGANQSTRQKIVELAAKNNWNFHLATEEYLAQMAEKGFESNRGFWAKVRSIFMNIIHEAKLRLGFRISDNDLAYVLWRTYQLQTEGKGILQDATKIDMERRLRVGNFSKRNGRLLFRDSLVTERTVESGMARSLYELQTKKKSYKFKEAYQDSMLGLKKFMEAVSMATGEDIADHENAYMAENQMSSRSTYETEFYKDNFFTPMMKAVTALINKGFEYNEVVDYLVAKHGLERNRELSVRDAILSEYKDEPEEIKRLMNEYHEQRDKVMELFDNGIIKKEDIEDKLNEVAFLYTSRISDYSGLSSLTGEEEEYENAARTLVSDMEEDNLKEIQVLWDKVNAATKETLRKNYDSGMMTKETYEKVSSMFMNYIPLRGWKEDTAADVYSYLISERSIFNAPVKAAVGRKSLADDPLATIGNMAESAILQGNRNLMKQKFLNLVINHPTELATVKEMWYVLNESTDEWEQSLPNIPDDATPEEVQNVIDEHERRMLELIRDKRAKKGRLDVPYKTLPPERKEHTVVVKRNGKEFTIFINGNPRVAQAVNGLTNPDATNHKLMQWVGRLNRQMAANFTTRNPAFVLSNLSRDLIFSSTAVAVKENRKYSARFMKNVAANLKDMYGLMQRHERGTLNLDNRKDRYFHEFLQYGGETGYTNLHSVDEYKKLVDRQIMDAQGKVDIGRIFGLKSGKLTTTTTLGIVPTFQFVAKWTEFGNRCAEDMSRFATYMTSREMGRSVLRSISDAKEVTVNFNKKGAGGYGATTFKNLYLFFNAAVQSLQNFGGLAKKNPKKFSVALSSFTAAGILLPMLNQMLISMFGDDDDKDVYNNLPEWVRKNNLCFWTGGKKFVTIPLPIELRAFYGTGEILHSLMNGDNVGRNWGMEFVGQFTELLPINPLGNTDAISTIVPDAGKPLYQAMINKDYFGSPIYKDSDFNKLMPEWTKAYTGTSKALVSSTELLNELTGGDKYSRGWLNANPALIEHYFESYFGGMGKTINQLGKTISMIWDEDERIMRNIPVANRFLSNENERNAFNRVNEEYYHFLEEFKETGQRLRGYGNEADMGILEYAEKEDFLYNSPEYERYEIMKDYQKDIKGIQDEIKETEDKPARKDLELLLNLTKMELVDELRSVK